MPLPLKVWEDINQLESGHDAVGDEDDSLVVSPDAFAVCCFQNGLYVHPSQDGDAVVAAIKAAAAAAAGAAAVSGSTEPGAAGGELADETKGPRDWNVSWGTKSGTSGRIQLRGQLSAAAAKASFEAMTLEEIVATGTVLPLFNPYLIPI